MKFKVGDLVKQVHKGYNTAPEDIGKVAVVTRVGLKFIHDGDGILIDDYSFNYKVSHSSLSRGEDGFELVESKFKIGDRVKSEYGTGTVCDVLSDFVGVKHDISSESFFHDCNGTCPMGFGWYSSKKEVVLVNIVDSKDYVIGIDYAKEEKMELKDISKKNLSEALKQVQEEKASAEVKYAKEVLRANMDRKDTLVREIKVRQEEIDKIDEAIKLFKV